MEEQPYWEEVKDSSEGVKPRRRGRGKWRRSKAKKKLSKMVQDQSLGV